jgi:uncharacterized membrane protein
MFVKTIFKRPSSIGIMLGMVFMALSLTPSLIPRAWTVQAAVAALSFLCGYGIGVGLNALWRYLQLPAIPQQYQLRISWVLLAISGLFLLYFVFGSLGWQNNVRQTVGLDPVQSADPLRMILLAAALTVLFLLVLRFLWWLVAEILRLTNQFMPRRVEQVIGITVAALVIFLLINDVLIGSIFDVLNATYAATNDQNYANVSPPSSSLRSGSPESLISWQSLGKEGRRFVGTGPTAEDIGEFWGAEAQAEPIRIYIGSESALTLQEQTDLALQELIRTNAFEREILVLVTSTGNGWVDANSINSVEYIFRGNTAIVAFQYSYLPSVYSLLADKDAATESSVAMFNRIHQHWQLLNEDARPALYLYALSLGTYGSQAAVTNVIAATFCDRFGACSQQIHVEFWEAAPRFSLVHDLRSLTPRSSNEAAYSTQLPIMPSLISTSSWRQHFSEPLRCVDGGYRH